MWTVYPTWAFLTCLGRPVGCQCQWLSTPLIPLIYLFISLFILSTSFIHYSLILSTSLPHPHPLHLTPLSTLHKLLIPSTPVIFSHHLHFTHALILSTPLIPLNYQFIHPLYLIHSIQLTPSSSPPHSLILSTPLLYRLYINYSIPPHRLFSHPLQLTHTYSPPHSDLHLTQSDLHFTH